MSKITLTKEGLAEMERLKAKYPTLLPALVSAIQQMPSRDWEKEPFSEAEIAQGFREGWLKP